MHKTISSFVKLGRLVNRIHRERPRPVAESRASRSVLSTFGDEHLELLGCVKGPFQIGTAAQPHMEVTCDRLHAQSRFKNPSAQVRQLVGHRKRAHHVKIHIVMMTGSARESHRDLATRDAETQRRACTCFETITAKR